MDTYKQVLGEPRATQTIAQERGIPGSAEYLRVEYALPDPYTAEEYTATLDNFNQRYKERERIMKKNILLVKQT